MTERERRALGLPPTKAQIALIESVRSDAEEKFKEIALQVASAARPLAEIAESVRPATEAMTQIAHEMNKQREVLNFHPEPMISRDVFFVAPIPRHQAVAPIDYDTLADKVAARVHSSASTMNAELFYDPKSKELSRTILRKKSVSAFEKIKGNKRKRLFERLLRAVGKFVKTEDLVEFLDCPDAQALTKIVQAINAKARRDLHISRLIEGRKGDGYRLNPDISIQRV